jgi:hypothetical protein
MSVEKSPEVQRRKTNSQNDRKPAAPCIGSLDYFKRLSNSQDLILQGRFIEAFGESQAPYTETWQKFGHFRKSMCATRPISI